MTCTPDTARKPIAPEKPFYDPPGLFALRISRHLPGDHRYGPKLTTGRGVKRGSVPAYRPHRRRFALGL